MRNSPLKRLQNKNIICIVIFSFIAFLLFVGGKPVPKIVNPYKDVNRKRFEQYKANLHIHTMASDGWMNPQSVVEQYRKNSYRILSITDHAVMTYPLEEFSKFSITAKVRKRINDKTQKPQESGVIGEEDVKFK